ncbi:AraC family transcriptional regulator [Streptomyces sp. SKN60]|uniref:helix-turn-helix domain-containing protein n=1 Tax=Streptomyces sp. SKN60 TaxID=2855506 RepID=UPI002248202C|nr:AraC family transcriptional regulator [Streptomyces sp. SKN60]MCX2184742.1 AraC family transcriptional regulator [Streptomyces sp. SKN60]
MYEERPARLAGAVVWRRELGAAADAADPGTRPVLPDGCMDLIWADGRLLVAGPDTRAYVPRSPAAHYAGVRFAPGEAAGVLGVEASAVRDERVDLAELWDPRVARRLADRVSGAADRAAALEDLVLRRAADAPAPDPLLRAVVARLRAGLPVGTAADQLGIGVRQLHRRSLAAFGYGPKTLARILRLQRALALVTAGVPAAEAAPRAGCVDQAHLAREMRALTGLTIGGYVAGLRSA